MTDDKHAAMEERQSKMQDWIQNKLVPATNRVTQNYWFSLIADAILIIVPFTMVSAIPSLWSLLRKLITVLPDITALSTYSFGLVGMFVAFIIPYNAMVREERKDRSLMAGFSSIGAYMMCMNPTTTDDGTVFTMWKFGSGGMFTAMVVGVLVGAIFKAFATKTFFSEDSLVPDFVKNWFDTIVGVLLSLLAAYIITFLLNLDLFTVVGLILSPVTNFARTLPGVVIIGLVMDMFYFFGVSGWCFTPITLPITQGAIAANAANFAAGLPVTNINAYGLSRYYMIGGEGNTLPLAIMMMFSKSKKNKMLGKATLVPSLFNINEPLFFSTVVDNPYMFIPMLIQAIVLPANAWIWLNFGWAGMHVQMFAMNNLPNAVSAYVLSNGDIRNAILVCVNLLLATLIWFPFWKAYDRNEAKKERKAEMEAESPDEVSA